jgi:hypothetical protein
MRMGLRGNASLRQRPHRFRQGTAINGEILPTTAQHFQDGCGNLNS